jgi:hypothetical protein
VLSPCEVTYFCLPVALAMAAASLSYDAATELYTYVWKTDKAWAKTCRQRLVKLKNGMPSR